MTGTTDPTTPTADLPRWIVTRRGLLRAERAVELDGEGLMIYRSPDSRLVFRIVGNGCGYLEEVTGEHRQRALAAAGPVAGA